MANAEITEIKVPVIVLEMTIEEAKELRDSLNKVPGSWAVFDALDNLIIGEGI